MFYGFGKNIFLITSKGYLYEHGCMVNIFENWGWKQMVIGTQKALFQEELLDRDCSRPGDHHSPLRRVGGGCHC